VKTNIEQVYDSASGKRYAALFCSLMSPGERLAESHLAGLAVVYWAGYADAVEDNEKWDGEGSGE